MPAVSATAGCIRVNRCDPDLPEPTSFDGCCSRMENAPAECCRALERCGTAGYFQNARPATRQHDDNGHSTHRKWAVFVRPRRRVASPMTAPLAGFGFGSLSLFQNGPHMREFPAACACVAVLFGGTRAIKRIQRVRENRSAAAFGLCNRARRRLMTAQRAEAFPLPAVGASVLFRWPDPAGSGFARCHPYKCLHARAKLRTTG
ncbi:hypothetical protein ACVWZ3_002293 [Bradyrhizobium sp. i1.3.6]